MKANNNDTFSAISRRIFGDSSRSEIIARMNPGVTEPIPEGANIETPSLKEINNRKINQLDVYIDNNLFSGFTNLNLTRSVDSVDLLSFEAHQSTGDLPKSVRPFSYSLVHVNYDGARVFTGRIVSVDPFLDSSSKGVKISCYSLPGVLSDCTPSPSHKTLNYENANLEEIARTLCEYFGINIVSDGSKGKISEVILDPSDSIMPFIVELAKQKGMLVSSTVNGDLYLKNQSELGEIQARLRQGAPPLLEISSFYSPQDYYSHLTGTVVTKKGTIGSQATVKNTLISGVFRPFNFVAQDIGADELNAAVSARLGRMFGSSINYLVKIPGWKTKAGKIFEPGDLITLESRDQFIFEPYTFAVRSVNFERSDQTEFCTLDLVLPEAFTLKIPSKMPWDSV